MSPDIDIIYTNDIFQLLSSDMTFGALGVIIKSTTFFNHSMLKYNLFPTCLYNLFGLNKSASIYSTFLNFSSRVAHGEILI